MKNDTAVKTQFIQAMTYFPVVWLPQDTLGKLMEFIKPVSASTESIVFF